MPYNHHRTSPSRAQHVKFADLLLKQFSKQHPIVHEQEQAHVAHLFTQLAFGGHPVVCDNMTPIIANLIATEGFPIDRSSMNAILDNVECASDIFQDLDRGWFGFTGYETHQMLEHWMRTHELVTLLKRIPPRNQLPFSTFILDGAHKKRHLEGGSPLQGQSPPRG